MASDQNMIQDSFLNQVRKGREQVTIVTSSGYKIKCRVKAFDRFSILVESGDTEQLIFKHDISGISVKRGFTNKLKIKSAIEKKAQKSKETEEEE